MVFKSGEAGFQEITRMEQAELTKQMIQNCLCVGRPQHRKDDACPIGYVGGGLNMGTMAGVFLASH